MRIDQARKLLAFWQGKLGLGAWRIKFEWLSKPEDNSHGHNEFDALHRTSIIRINRPGKLDSEVTVEYVLVHELLHLVLYELELVEKANKKQKEITLERVINQLTNALIERTKNAQ